ncbi:MAG: GspH/FimT family pseudopilin [Parahaliea sp.]
MKKVNGDLDLEMLTSTSQQIRTGIQRGFSLIELMTVLSISALLLMMAGPSFEESISRNRLRTTLHDLIAMSSFTRSEAIIRNVTVSACASSNGTSCTTSGWDEGWIVFVDNGNSGGTAGDGLLNGNELLLRVGDSAPGSVSASVRGFVSTTSLTFMPTGRVARNQSGTVVLCDDRGIDYARALVINVAGQPRIATTAAGGFDGGSVEGHDGSPVAACIV